MAACHPQDGDPGEPDKITPSCLSQPLKTSAGGAQNSAVASSAKSGDNKLTKEEVGERKAIVVAGGGMDTWWIIFETFG